MTTTTAPALTRRETLDGTLREYDAFGDLVASLSPEDWATPSRCTGFDVRDVAGHVIGLLEDIVAGRIGARNAEEEAASVRDDPPAAAAARLRAAREALVPLADALDDDAAWASPSGFQDLTMGDGILLLWYDLYVHADDIRAALGRPVERGPGERAALAYLAGELESRGFGPARFELTDAGPLEVVVGAADAATPVHRLGAHEFILAATGRLDPGPLGLDPSVNIYAG